jgi:uncharacterized protein YpmS
MMKNYKLRFAFFLAALLAASLACNFPGLGDSAATPTAPVPVSSEAVQQLEEMLQSAAATAVSGGKVELAITEAQLTSLVALELQAIQEPEVDQVQIRLRDGQIMTTAKVRMNGIPLDLALTSRVIIGPDGLPKSSTVSAKLGPLPIPDSMLQLFTQELDDMLAEQMVFQGQRIFVESLNIADGVMLVTGYLK